MYLIFALINCLAFPPITGANDTDDPTALSKTDGENAAPDLAETEIPCLVFTVRKVLGDYAVRVGECDCAKEKATPCFSWFSAFLLLSHLNRAFFIHSREHTERGKSI